MTFLVDTNVILYALVEATPAFAASCRRLLDAVVDGRAPGVTSAAVLEEVLHVSATIPDERFRATAGIAYAMFTPLLPVTDDIIRRALDVDHPGLGANDRVHVATCRANDIPAIVSADRAFDGVPGLRRIDPLDTSSVDRLIER